MLAQQIFLAFLITKYIRCQYFFHRNCAPFIRIWVFQILMKIQGISIIFRENYLICIKNKTWSVKKFIKIENWDNLFNVWDTPKWSRLRYFWIGLKSTTILGSLKEFLSFVMVNRCCCLFSIVFLVIWYNINLQQIIYFDKYIDLNFKKEIKKNS